MQRIRSDAEFAEIVANQLRGFTPTFARTIDELITNDEDSAVEFKSTARRDIQLQQRNPAIEDAIVKTVAALLNTDGGTLLIGVAPVRGLTIPTRPRQRDGRDTQAEAVRRQDPG